MENLKEKKSIKESVIEKIKSKAVSPKSRLHFILRGGLLFFGVLVVFAAAVFIASFLVFSLKVTGAFYLPLLGPGGILSFLRHFPWTIFTAAFLLVIVLELFIKKFSFGYRRPVLYMVISILLGIFILGFAVALTPVHPRLFEYSIKHKVPMAGQMYRGYGRMHFRDAFIGTVAAVRIGGFELTTPDEQFFSVNLNNNSFSAESSEFKQGDYVIVRGIKNGQNIDAFRVRKIESLDFMPGMMRGRGMMRMMQGF